jgi:hypothetical protein
VQLTVIAVSFSLSSSPLQAALARNLTPLLRDATLTLPGYSILGDDAFGNGATNDIYATKAYESAHLRPDFQIDNRALFHIQQKAKRQGVEWGMRTLQAMWPRVKMPLPFDNAKRELMLSAAIFLNNFVARHVDNHNQLKTVYQEALLRGGM